MNENYPEIPLVDAILTEWRAAIGADYTALRNHIHRTCYLCRMLADLDDTAWEQVGVAGAFHDLGIWSDGTWDYLDPSAARARAWLEANDHADWIPGVEAMILDHHKITAVADTPLADTFRKADWIDVSLGLRGFGVSRADYRALLRAWPVAGFHGRLVQFTLANLLRKPWSPLPMFRW